MRGSRLPKLEAAAYQPSSCLTFGAPPLRQARGLLLTEHLCRVAIPLDNGTEFHDYESVEKQFEGCLRRHAVPIVGARRQRDHQRAELILQQIPAERQMPARLGSVWPGRRQAPDRGDDQAWHQARLGGAPSRWPRKELQAAPDQGQASQRQCHRDLDTGLRGGADVGGAASGLVAGVIAPLMMGSTLAPALTSAGFLAIGLVAGHWVKRRVG